MNNCLNCAHKDVCLRRSAEIFLLYIVTGRYDEVEDARKNYSLFANDCEAWQAKGGPDNERISG